MMTGYPAHHLAGFRLIAGELYRLHRRTDERYVARTAYLCEMRVLGKKPVTGMYRLDVGDLRCADNAWHVKIAFRAGRWTYAYVSVRVLHVMRLKVRFLMHRNTAYTLLLASTDYTLRDLASVRY